MNWNFRQTRQFLAVGVLASALSACGASSVGLVANTAPVAITQPTALPTSVPTPRLPEQPAIVPRETVSGTGRVASAHEASLLFLAQGRVEQVLVEEGQMVSKGQLLATLDLRMFDAAVAQAEAGVASAQAQLSALDEAPRAADIQAAKAQVKQAQIALAQAQTGQTQDIRSTEAGLVAMQSQLQATRDQLSAAKTSAERQVSQAALTLTQAQARYAHAKYNWEYAQSSGNDPIVPSVTSSTGVKSDNKLSDGQRENYYALFVQAEAAMQQAEQAVAQAQVALENARQAEVNGVQVGEQQFIQSQATLDKLRVPADQDRVAAAQAALELARANLARLNIDPNQSQRTQAQAGVAAALATLEQAKLNREYAQLRAPFDGLIAQVDIEVGESVAPGGRPAISLLDPIDLRFEVPIAEVDIAQVAIGQSAQVQLDALPNAPLAGTVSYIAPAATQNGAIGTYLVRVALDATPHVRIGMSGQLSFIPAAATR